jgi:hypothetical protein
MVYSFGSSSSFTAKELCKRHSFYVERSFLDRFIQLERHFLVEVGKYSRLLQRIELIDQIQLVFVAQAQTRDLSSFNQLFTFVLKG